MKWFGKIGFAVTQEIKPGVWQPVIEEREYYGEVMKLRKQVSNQQDSTNDDIRINNSIRIIADPFAQNNFFNIAYVEFMGTKLKVSDVEVDFPGLILSLGGIYNE